MILPAGLLVLLGGWSAPQDVDAALADGDYARAWRLADQAPDERTRARARSQVLYRAGDPAGALQAARAGLRASPQDLELLYRATGAALWLEDPDLVRQFAARLGAAVDGADLGPEHRPGWEAALRDYQEQEQHLVRRESARLAAVRRARWTAVAVLLALAGLVLGVAFAGRADQGRSRSPVS